MRHVSWNIAYNLTFCLSQDRTSLLAWQQLCWVWERFEGNLFEYLDGHGNFGAGVRVYQGKHIQIVAQTARVHRVAGRDGRYLDLLYFQACCLSAMENFPVFSVPRTATRPAHFVRGHRVNGKRWPLSQKASVSTRPPYLEPFTGSQRHPSCVCQTLS